MTGAGTKFFLKDLGWTGAGIAIALCLDFLFYLGAGRFLGPEVFGYFGVVLSIYYLAVRAPFSVIEITARKIEKDKLSVFAQLGRSTLVAGLSVFLLFLLLSPLIAELLGLPLDALLMFAALFPVAYIVPVAVGSLEGAKRFREYAIYEVVTSFFKMAGLILILAGLGLIGAVSSLIIEIYSAVIILYIFLRPEWEVGSFDYFRTFTRSGIFILSIFAAFNIDILLLKIFMSVKTVGLYTSVAVLGKALFFGAGAVSKVSFPRFGSSGGDRRLLLNSSLFILMGGAAMMVFLSFFGRTFIKLAFSSKYVSAASFAPDYMFFMTIIGLCLLLGNFYLSRDSSYVKYIVVLPVLQFLLVMMFHGSVIQIIYAGTIAALITLAVLIYPILSSARDL